MGYSLIAESHSPPFTGELEGVCLLKLKGIKILDGTMEKSDKWASPQDNWKTLKPLARTMRTEMTLSERTLWKYIRNRQILGFKFRRQHVICNFIVDFYCHELKLVIEVDGLSHEEQKPYDRERQIYLENSGYSVIRFYNEDVVRNISGVIDELMNRIQLLKHDPA